MTKTLRPIYVRDEYFKPLADDMLQELYDIIFKPIFDILNIKKSTRINSYSDIKNALRAGRIFWQDGYFYGQFNAVVGMALRELGAKFSRSRHAYKLSMQDIPMDLRTDIVIGKGMNRSKTEQILNHLDEIKDTKIVLGAGDKAAAMLDGLNGQAIKTFKVLPDNISIPLDLTEKQKQNLKEKYNENMDLYINGWKEEQIERLRAKTVSNIAVGARADRLAKIVQSEYGTSKAKSLFLAKQETSLFVSKYRQERYESAGAREYIWSTSSDERVRHDHKILDGKKFSWDSPPIVDQATGARGNPGEYFGCRCISLPIIRLRG